MIITPLSPKSESLQMKSDQIDSLITEVNKRTLSPLSKVAAALFVFIGWAYWAYQNWQKSESLAKLKDKVLEISTDSEELPEHIKNVYTSAVRILGSQLNSLDFTAVKFELDAPKEIEAVFGDKWSQKFKAIQFPLYYGIARSLETDDDLAKFKKLPAVAKRITLSGENPVTKEKIEINEVIDTGLVEKLRSKLKELDASLQATRGFPEYISNKTGINARNLPRLTESMIKGIIDTTRSPLSTLGAVYFQNIFTLLDPSPDNEYKDYLKIFYHKELFSIALQLAQTTSVEQSMEAFPSVLKRVADLMKTDAYDFLESYKEWASQNPSQRISPKEFLDAYEASKRSSVVRLSPQPFSAPITPKTTPILDSLDEYETAKQTTISVEPEVEGQVDNLRDLDDYTLNLDSQQRGYFRRGLDYLSSWVIGN